MKKLIFILCMLVATNCWATYEADGTDDTCLGGDIAQIDTATTLSCSAWVYHDDLDDDDGIIVKMKATGITDGFLLMRDDSGANGTDTYLVYLADSADTDTVRVDGATGASPATTWTHVAFTWQGASATGLRLYVNGVEDANSPGDSSSVNAINADVGAVRVGNTGEGTPRPFDGKITEVACWESVLSAGEVEQLALSRVKRMPLQIDSSNLIFYVPLDQGVDGTQNCFNGVSSFLDLSGNGHHFSGSDGANNTGSWCRAEEVLTY